MAEAKKGTPDEHEAALKKYDAAKETADKAAERAKEIASDLSAEHKGVLSSAKKVKASVEHEHTNIRNHLSNIAEGHGTKPGFAPVKGSTAEYKEAFESLKGINQKDAKKLLKALDAHDKAEGLHNVAKELKTHLPRGSFKQEATLATKEAGSWASKLAKEKPLHVAGGAAAVTALMAALWPNQEVEVKQADGSTQTESKMGVAKTTAVALGSATTVGFAASKLLQDTAKAASHVRV